MTLVSESFASFAKARCRGLGMPELRFVILPHPIADRPPEELREIALARFDEIGSALTSR